MFWADRIAGEIEARFPRGKNILIRDEKTLSGRVHVGAMRGVVIHGVVAEALSGKGVSNTYNYELNDFDPFDTVPSYLDEKIFKEHLGKPLYKVPSPVGGFANYAEYFGEEFKEAHAKAGYTPEYYRATELYQSGKMDPYILTALERAGDIRRILKEVSGSEKDSSWLPISVVCENCGKMMTTRAHDYDPVTKSVAYACDKPGEGMLPCGHSARISPTKGKAKLFWKTDWAAKWAAMGTMVEGAGKDHSTKGGARDVANHIAKEIYGIEPPFDIPYEFFLVGGQKMSTSKGRGSSAKEIADLVPTKIFRLAFFGKDINQQINFDPEGDTIPVLYDQYDKLAEGYKTKKDDDYSRLFEYIHPGTSGSKRSSSFLARLFGGSQKLATPEFFPRFSQVAFMVQMPHLNMESEFAKVKGGALTSDDKKELDERATYAKRWLEEYAPEKFVFKIQDTLPEEAKNLSPEQKKALVALLGYIETTEKFSGEDLHHKLHEIKESEGIEPGKLFSAIYLSILGKSYGPKAGWFLSVLDRHFVIRRLKEVTG